MHIGVLHVTIVHFPIALSIAAVVADAVWLVGRKPWAKHAGLYCLIFAALSAIPVAITGDAQLEDMQSQSLSSEQSSLAETHEDLGIATLAVVLAAATFRVATTSRGWLKGIPVYIYGAMMAGLLVLITLTGHWGGMLAFGRDYLQPLFQ